MGNAISLFRHGYNQSFNIPSPPLTEKNLPDQTGKVFIITGSNTGVGYEVARILYSLHGSVYLACRTESKAATAISNIKSAHPSSNGKLSYLHLDLSDLTTIKASADSFLAKENRLDWLDNNAGVMVPPTGSKSAQNHELQLGTNVLGPFLFTKLLTPILKSTASRSEKGSVRVSWAGSLGVDISPPGGVQFTAEGEIVDFGGGQRAYGSSKAANWFLAHEFARHYPNDGVLHNAYNPGSLKTDLQRHAAVRMGDYLTAVFNYLLLHPAVMGAYTELYAGLAQELTLEADQGGYVVPWGRRSVWNRPDVVDGMKEGGVSEKLWEWCERETQEFA